MAMQKRRLGRSPLHVAPLAFGGNVFGWTADEKTSFALLDAFVDAGFDLIDTADGYSAWAPGNSGGESETIIGRWLARSGKRDKVVIATKVGKYTRRPGLSAANIAAAVEDSLKRLGVDTIDLYQSHADDTATPIAETLGAYARLIEAGKLRAIGASNFTAARLAGSLAVSDAHGLPRYETLQPEYNLMRRAGYEADLAPLAVRESIGVIPYYALASGFLTGKYRDASHLSKSARGAGVAKYLDARGTRVLEALDDIASRHSATPAQVALAWLATRPAIAAPIASATSVEQLRELVGSARVALSVADIAALDSASDA
jgi:aryl-alcohol dehydrogenase-like predicted oxidoreductase